MGSMATGLAINKLSTGENKSLPHWEAYGPSEKNTTAFGTRYEPQKQLPALP